MRPSALHRFRSESDAPAGEAEATETAPASEAPATDTATGSDAPASEAHPDSEASARVGASTRPPRPRPSGDPSASGARTIYGAIILGAMLVVCGLLVTQLLTLILAAMITVIISLPLSWCAEHLEPFGIPRPIGALLALLLGLAAAAGLVVLLAPQLISQSGTLINKAPGLVHEMVVRISHLTGTRPGRLSHQLQSDVTTFVRQPSHLVGPIASIGLNAATVVAGLVVALISAYFIAARPQTLVDALLSLFSHRARGEAERVLSRIRRAWLGWFRGVAISMVLVGLLLYVGLGLIVGLQFALAFSVISGIAEVVPYLGALASGVPPVAYALTISPGKALIVLVIYIAVHQIEANLIGPIVMARSVHLHPAVIALGVVAVGEVFGFLGLLIAVPILSLGAILLDELWSRPRQGEKGLGSPAAVARPPRSTG